MATPSHIPVRRPLEGLIVVDLSQVVSGAVTSMLMADFGAQVIKVEPLAGESYRNSGFPLGIEEDPTNLNILRWTRGKQSVAIDLKSDEGIIILKDLLAKADVLVENFRPGVLSRLGVGPDVLKELNPDLIYASVSGFGHDEVYPSPYRDRPAYAIITEAMGGLMHLAGDGKGAPIWMGFAMADIFSGVLAFAGTALALIDRQSQHTQGGRVDIAMYDGAVFMNDLAMAVETMTETSLGAGQYTLQSPWGPFQAKDGYVVLAVLTDRQWAATCEVIERPDLASDVRLASGMGRSRHHAEVVEPAVSAWCSTRTKEECTERFLAAHVPAAPVNTTEDLLRCPQVHARNMLVDVDAPGVGTARVVGNPIKLNGAESSGAAVRIPRLGEHTEQVLRDLLHRSAEDIQQLLDTGVVRRHEVGVRRRAHG